MKLIHGIIVAGLILAAAGPAFGQSEMSVSVKEAQARSSPSFLGAIVAVLPYGERVPVLGEQAGWTRVRLPSAGEGWVHSSALTTKRVVLQAGSGGVSQSASSSEVALAGKGFNQEVEARYRDEKGLDYTWVDRMEGFLVSLEQTQAFFLEGGLEPQGVSR
jgi:SH3-like domain-containing protein